MAFDPRKTLTPFTINNSSCPAAGVKANNAAGKKKNFLDNLTKLGDLEFLNDIGGGNVGKGLRTLAAVSDSIRVGKSVVPGREGDSTYNTTFGKIVGTAVDAVSEGTEVVMDAVGLGGAVEAVGNINIGAANRAYEAGSQVFNRVKNGEFSLEDIPEVFSDLQNLETLVKGIFPGFGGSDKAIHKKELCGATPYAMDLIAFAPKFQFMFIVEIKYAPEYAPALGEIAKQVAFVVKTSTRPKFNVDYEEVNMYGFRTRVARRVEYQPMQMSFYDDNKNAALKFFVAYMRATSPIANIKTDSPQYEFENNGMNFTKPPAAALFDGTSPPMSGHSSSYGPLVGNAKSLLSEIRIHHVFDYGNKMNTYHFYNPRITSFNPSDLTMLETGDGCEFSFEFLYDGIYIDHMIDLSKLPYKLTELTEGGTRPIFPIYDETGDKPGEGEPDQEESEQNAPGAGFLGGFASGLFTSSDGTPTFFGNVATGVKNIAGGFSNTVSDIGSGISKTASGLTEAIGDQISQAQKAVGGLGTTISNAFKSENTLASEGKATNDNFLDTYDA